MNIACVKHCLSAGIIALSFSVSANDKRFDFAHSYFGLGIQQLPSINTGNGVNEMFDLPSRDITRISWGGVHFWGHADFELSVPLTGMDNDVNHGNEVIKSRFAAGSNYGLAANIYPLPLRENTLRPFIGFGFFSSLSYQQGDDLEDSPSIGGTLFYTPIKIGASYLGKHWMYEFGLQKLPNDNINYYTTRNDVQSVQFDSTHAYFTTKYVWESSKHDKSAESLSQKSYAWTLGGVLNYFRG